MILILLLCSAWIIPCMNGLEYHFINQKLTWHEAQQFCRENYLDLATVTSLEEAGALKRLKNYTGLAWIGLLIDPESFTSVWRWTATGDALGSYQKWQAGVPNGNTPCISVDSTATWSEHVCYHQHTFLCFQDVLNVKEYYFFTSPPQTWEGARDYCRKHFTDLAIIESPSESAQVESMVTDYYCWIGLYYGVRNMWRWSDGTRSTFTNWGTTATNQHCAAEDLTHVWTPKNCGQTLPFFCHGAEKRKTKLFHIKFLSGLDMTNANNYRKMLQQMEIQMKQMGLININISLKSSPQKQISGTNSFVQSCSTD